MLIELANQNDLRAEKHTELTEIAKTYNGPALLQLLNGSWIVLMRCGELVVSDGVNIYDPATPLGYVHNGEVRYYRPAAVQENAPYFNIDGLKSLPKVGIAYGYSNVEGDVVKMMIKKDYKGIVYAGVGNGNIHKNVFPELEKARKDGIIVVRSSRVPTGATTLDAEVDDNKYEFVASWSLNPQKARILLMLALTKTDDWKTIQKYFNNY